MSNEAFEKWYKRTFKDYANIANSLHPPENMKFAYEAGQSASAARIAELEADCKVMAKIVINNHEDTCMECPAIGCKKGLNTGKPFIRDCCICPACTIAAREGK